MHVRPQAVGLGDMPGEVECGLAGLHTTAVAAHVDLDINRQGDPGFARRHFECLHLGDIVSADPDPGVVMRHVSSTSVCASADAPGR